MDGKHGSTPKIRERRISSNEARINKGVKMKKSIVMVMMAAVAIVITGCKSVEVERNPQSLATVQNADGSVTVVRDHENKPVVLDGGWSVDYFQHWNWQEFDSLSATAGDGVKLDINNYRGGADSTNLTALVSTSLDGITQLVTKTAEAYEKVAGGGAQANTAINTASRLIGLFTEKGGNLKEAKVSTDSASNTVKISDGSVCVECDPAGNCTDGKTS